MYTMMMMLMVHIIAKNSRDNMTNENERSYKRVCVCGRVFFDRVQTVVTTLMMTSEMETESKTQVEDGLLK